MNHSFKPIPGSVKCRDCAFAEIAHTDKAECDCCPNIGIVDIMYGNMLMCKTCQDAEKKAHADNMTPEKQQERIDRMNSYQNAAIEASRAIDASVSVRTDLFNAATTAIIDLKKVIDEDTNITNKPYALASELTERFKHFKQVIFSANEAIIEAGNQQKAIQVYLNQLANQLREEERAELKIADINYQPIPPKAIKPKTITVKKPKLDKAELNKYATELGISAFTLQMIVQSKGCTVEQAANILRKSINESKSEAN